MNVSFVVIGKPEQQGSKVKTRWGGMREANDGLQPWRDAVSWNARQAMTGRQQLLGPVQLEVTFVFGRLKSHYGTGRNASVVKSSAPVFKDSAPDLDKLVRAIGDAMTGVIYRDDSQIVSVTATKRYGSEPHAEITVTPAAPPDTG